ncbi:MAG: hypothetical protein KDB58_08525 [Solirubrobacterales bacterium]|nr:hypothetical protein [Solirubrobacterales bacterium]MCB8971349.1 hypothetical protein [Thermoleophilales bacterium]MCO5325794.1 hypothetical protein [Solirubrobacterales bacterium]
MRITDRIGDAVERLRPAPRVPAARRRGMESQALQGGGSVGRSKLQEQRDELAREFVELQWDLGGIAYEMASRDYFRLDVLTRHAAKLQQVDSALGQAERMLRLSEDGVAGTCPSCGGVQARGAIYCWQCGKELTPATVAMPATPSPAPVSATAAGGGMPTVQLPETAPIAAAPEQQPR